MNFFRSMVKTNDIWARKCGRSDSEARIVASWVLKSINERMEVPSGRSIAQVFDQVVRAVGCRDGAVAGDDDCGAIYYVRRLVKSDFWYMITIVRSGSFSVNKNVLTWWQVDGDQSSRVEGGCAKG